ncbi:MAG: J domain-containing protein [Acidimicrobiia bacterium]|nr:J domain-containing protein [Acidimicrobiia bacterium]
MNFYEALNLQRSATTEEIEEAYRALARKVHPDLNRNDPTPAEARMKLLNRIRETLTDPKRRAKYELELAAGSATTRVESAIDETLRQSRDDVLFWKRVKLTAAAGLVLGLLLGVGFWVHDSMRSKTVGLPLPPPTAPTQAPKAPPAPSLPKAAPAVPRPIQKKQPEVVEFGSSADRVLSIMGKPDQVEELPAQGIRILHYGKLRLVFKNNKLIPGSGIQKDR